jgi:hypothetical protein
MILSTSGELAFLRYFNSNFKIFFPRLVTTNEINSHLQMASFSNFSASFIGNM